MQVNRFLGSVLLIAGTSIGAGMLALPVSTATYGVFPSIIMFIMCWFCMTLCGLLTLEVNLWLKPGANIVSMAYQTLGNWGKIIAWITYFLLFYSLIAAYLSGMGDLVQKVAYTLFNIKVSNGTGSLLLILLVASAIYIGMQFVDYLNRFFFFGKFLTYLVVVIVVAPFIQLAQLTHFEFQKAWLALPIILTSFGFQNTIPGLRVYLQEDVKKLRLAILIGSSIPLFVYLIWELVIIGVVPVHGERGLQAILISGQPATGLAAALDYILNNSWISKLFKLFTFCAIITSFIGVSFSLFDFLMDSFTIQKNKTGRAIGLLATFLPPVIFAFVYPNGFIMALGYAGIFAAVLLGIFPVLMSWSGRYWKKIATGYRPKIPVFISILIVLFCLGIIYAQIITH